MQKAVILFLILLSVCTASFNTISYVRPEFYFTRGSEITYAVTSGDGATGYCVITIESLTERNGGTTIFAKNQVQNDQHRNTLRYRMTYYCDSVNWYVDPLNHLDIPLEYSSIVSLRSDSLVYPYRMKAGDILPAASGSELIYGTANNERYVLVNNRKVVASESVAAGGEMMQAFRIESVLIKGSVADHGVLSKIPTETEYSFTEWFVPSKGVVKSEIKTNTGTTTTLFESVK